jgi:hypothetical protein
MSPQRRPTFLQGVLVALISSFFGAALLVALSGAFGAGATLRFVIAASAGAYLAYLLALRGTGAGRVTIAVAWLLAACTIGAFLEPLSIYCIAHTGLIWFARSALFHRSIVSAGADLVLSGLALAAACWAVRQSHSAWLASWCFFLVQAAFVAIPASLAPASAAAGAGAGDDRFSRAERAAHAALRRYGDAN